MGLFGARRAHVICFSLEAETAFWLTPTSEAGDLDSAPNLRNCLPADGCHPIPKDVVQPSS
jgi:hypothetical protein